jgi:hypothetical protein
MDAVDQTEGIRRTEERLSMVGAYGRVGRKVKYTEPVQSCRSCKFFHMVKDGTTICMCAYSYHAGHPVGYPRGVDYCVWWEEWA